MMNQKRLKVRRASIAAIAATITACVGSRHTRADAAYAWGMNNGGQLGNGSYDTSYPFGYQSSPAPVINLSSGVSVVAAGSVTSLAVQNGTVYGWGRNSTTPQAIPGLSGGGLTIASGDLDNLAIQNGALYGWGSNNYGEVGNGTSSVGQPTPVAVSGMSSGVTAIAAGLYYSLAVKNGGAYGWGANWHGQLGNGTMLNSPTPVPITALSSGVTAVAAGGSYAEENSVGGLDGTYVSYGLAVQNGGVFAWGYNATGQLGDGNTANTSTPVPVVGLSNGVTSIAAGSKFSLAVHDGNVFAWGDNFYGELGNGTTTNELTPEETDPTDLSNIKEVAACFFSSYALSSDGSLWVWGDNEYGELGLGPAATTDYLAPQHLLPPSGYVFTSINAQADGEFALATLAPVPEPATIALVGIACIGLLARRRRLVSRV